MVSRSHPATAGARALVQTAALAVAVVFLLVGVLGFVPGITTNYSELELAGHGSKAELLGLFQVSVLHNLLHLGLGAVGLAMAARSATARTYLLAGGAAYLGLWAYGLFLGEEDHAVNFVPLNSADNWLHLVLGLGMIGLGVMLSRPSGRRTAH